MKIASRVVWGGWCMRIVFKMAERGPPIVSCECSTNFILERNTFRNESHSRIMWIAPKFSYFHLKLNTGMHYIFSLILRRIGALNRSRKLRNSKVKYKFTFTRRCPRGGRRHYIFLLTWQWGQSWRYRNVIVFKYGESLTVKLFCKEKTRGWLLSVSMLIETPLRVCGVGIRKYLCQFSLAIPWISNIHK